MLREYPNNVTFHDRGFIEQLGGYFLDSVAMGHELRLPLVVVSPHSATRQRHPKSPFPGQPVHSVGGSRSRSTPMPRGQATFYGCFDKVGCEEGERITLARKSQLRLRMRSGPGRTGRKVTPAVERALLKLSANDRERSAASGLNRARNQPITNWTQSTIRLAEAAEILIYPGLLARNHPASIYSGETFRPQ